MTVICHFDSGRALYAILTVVANAVPNNPYNKYRKNASFFFFDLSITYCRIRERKKGNKMLESDCCYAPVILEDICTRCKEHCCPVWVETEEDNGTNFHPGT
jgi:hypothetical protein